jgi:hypothetical protein
LQHLFAFFVSAFSLFANSIIYGIKHTYTLDEMSYRRTPWREAGGEVESDDGMVARGCGRRGEKGPVLFIVGRRGCGSRREMVGAAFPTQSDAGG